MLFERNIETIHNTHQLTANTVYTIVLLYSLTHTDTVLSNEIINTNLVCFVLSVLVF